MKTNIINKNKTNFLLTTCYILLTTAGLFLLTVKPLYAQKVGLSISPPLLEVMIKPGKTITQAYDLKNNSDQDLYLTPKIVPFTPADHHGHINLNLGHTLRGIPSEHLGGVTSFFSLQNSNLRLNQPFKLSAGSKQQLVLKIDIPPNNQEKDYYYTFLIEQTDQGEFIPNASGGSHRIKIGANILMTVSESGEPETDFQIAEFKAEPKFADLFDTVKFRLLVENTGQAYFKPNGKIEIYNTLFNKKTAELELLPENVLVDSAREIRCSKNKDTSEVEPSNTSEVSRAIPCQFSSFLPGKYKAIIKDHEPLTTNTQHLTYFYLFPYRFLLALIVIGLIIWQIRRKLIIDNK